MNWDKPISGGLEVGYHHRGTVIRLFRKSQPVSSQAIPPDESQFKITVEMGKTSGKAMVSVSHTLSDELSERQTRQLD